MSDSIPKKTAKRTTAKKAAKKVADEAAMRELREAKDLKAWRVAQLAAQLAASDHLGCGVQRNPVPAALGQSPYMPNHMLLDRWFRALLDRAEWMLGEAWEKNVIRFEDLFAQYERYSHSRMFRILNKSGVGEPWHNKNKMSDQCVEIEGIVINHFAELLAQFCIRSPISSSIDQKDEILAAQKKFRTVVENVLREYEIQGSERLEERIGAVIPEEHIGQDVEVFTFPEAAGVDVLKDDAITEGWVYSDRVKDVFNHFRIYRSAAGDVVAKNKKEGGQGGIILSKGVDAHALFKSIRLMSVEEQYWSFTPDKG
jgi:hypothetical protein